MAKKVTRYFIRVHANMPEHPKVEGLSDKAFRLLLDTWCWSKRTESDGHIQASSWTKRGTPKARAELVTAGLFDDDLAGGVIVHDWDDWQQTNEEAEEVAEHKSAAGTRGAHMKWHVGRSLVDPTCSHCQTDGKAIAGVNDSR